MVSVGLRTENFNMASNYDGRMENLLNLSNLVWFRQEIPFLSKFGPKIKIVSLSWDLVHRLIQICKFQWWCSLFQFLTRNTSFGQIWSKNQNWQFQLKVVTQNNSNMQNSVVIFNFSLFRPKVPFLAKFGPDSQKL